MAGSRSLGTLTLDILARTASFEQGMDRAARTADKRMKEIEARAKKFGAVVGGALLAGAGLVADQLRRTIDHMDELSKAAQRANMPTEDFTKLAYAADLADVSIQDLQSSMGRLAKAQGDAEKSTSTQARVFEALGIATKDAEGNLRATQEVFLDFADAFQRHRGSPEIMAAGMQIFGRSFQNLIPLLKDGSQGLREAGEEAEALGLAFGDEAGAQAEKFNDDLTRLQAAFRGVWVQVAQQLLPQLINLTDQFVAAAKDGDTLKNTADNIAEALVRIANTATQFGAVIGKLGELREMLVSIENTAKRFSLGSILGIGDKVRAALPDWLYTPIGGSGAVRPTDPRAAPARETDYTLGAPLNESELAAQARRLRGALGDADKAPKSKGGGKSDAQREAEQLQRSYDSLMETMRERIDLMGVESEVSKMLYRVTNGDLKALDDTRRQALVTLAEEFDAKQMLREEIEKENKAREEDAKRIEDGLKYGEQMLSDLQFELELMKMGNAERAAAIQLRGLEKEAVEQYGEAIVQANRDIEESMKQIQLMDGMRGEFADFFEDVVTGTKSIKDAFADMLNNIAAMITRRIAENWVDQLFGQMGTSQTGSSGGWIQMIAGLFGGGKANGGGVSGGKIYPVTEFGDEMLTVRGRNYLLTASSGHVTNNKQMPYGGGVNVTQNFINPRMTNLQTDSQRAREEARKVQRATARA